MKNKKPNKIENIDLEKVSDEQKSSKTFLPVKQNDVEIAGVGTKEQKSKNEDGSVVLKNKKNKVSGKNNEPLIKKFKKRFNTTVKEAKEIAQENKEEVTPTLDKRFDEAQTDVKKSSSKARIYFYLLCFLINIVCFSFLLFLFSSSAMGIKEALDLGSNTWFCIAILSFFVIMLLETFIISSLIKGTSKVKRFFLSYKTATVGRFYDCITPLKTGGQAFQISYLHKFGENGKSATTVSITKYVINQFVYLIAIVFLLFNISNLTLIDDSVFASIINITAYVGLGFQLLWLVTIMFLSYSKKIGPAMVIGVLKFLSTLRIIKNYRVAYVKVLKFVKEYQLTMKKCLNNFWRFVFIILSTALVMIIKWSVPFMLYSGFCGFDASLFFPMLSYSMLLELALGFWILPGNVVFADLGFLALFRPFFDNTFFWALLFWRILTYYSYIFAGIIVKVYDTIKYDWIKKPIIKIQSNSTKTNNKKQKK